MSYPYQGQSNQYSANQTSAANVVPQQQRQQRQPQGQHISQPHLASTTPQVPNYQQPNAYPIYNGVPQVVQQGSYSNPAAYAQGSPGFPVPNPAPAGGSAQRGQSGQPTSLYPQAHAGGSFQRSPSGQPATLYPQAHAGGSLQRSPSGQPATLYPPSGGAMQRSPSGQPATLYPPAGSSMQRSSSQRSPSGQPANLYPHPGSSLQRSSSQRSPSGQPANLYPQPGSSMNSSQRSPSGQAAALYSQAPTGSSVQRGYPPQAAAHQYPPAPTYNPVMSHAAPPYQPQTNPLHPDAYGYDNGGHTNEDQSKSPPGGPVQGPHYTCRLPHCNQPMFFDRRFNEFWEWCSTQHIQTALGRGMEKVCRNCGVWPRKYNHKYCGGGHCNKKGYPLSSY